MSDPGGIHHGPPDDDLDAEPAFSAHEFVYAVHDLVTPPRVLAGLTVAALAHHHAPKVWLPLLSVTVLGLVVALAHRHCELHRHERGDAPIGAWCWFSGWFHQPIPLLLTTMLPSVIATEFGLVEAVPAAAFLVAVIAANIVHHPTKKPVCPRCKHAA